MQPSKPIFAAYTPLAVGPIFAAYMQSLGIESRTVAYI